MTWRDKLSLSLSLNNIIIIIIKQRATRDLSSSSSGALVRIWPCKPYIIQTLYIYINQLAALSNIYILSHGTDSRESFFVLFLVLWDRHILIYSDSDLKWSVSRLSTAFFQTCRVCVCVLVHTRTRDDTSRKTHETWAFFFRAIYNDSHLS